MNLHYSYIFYNQIFIRLGMRQIVNIQLGQCGNAIGLKFLEKILEEHGIDKEGNYVGTNDYQRQRTDVFFEQVATNTYRTRSVLVDLEPGPIDTVLGSPLAGLYDPDCFVVGSGGGSNNWAVGHYTQGAQLAFTMMDSVRQKIEACDHLEGFQVLQSMGGGTGSGLGSLCCQNLKDLYGDRLIQTFPIFPSQKVSDTIVQPYNSILSINYFVQHIQLCNVIDNQSLLDICQKKLKLSSPTYNNLNQLVSTVISDATCGLRFPGQLNSNLRKQAMNLVTFPRIHFFMNAISPYLIDPKSKNSAPQIISNLFMPYSFLTSADPRHGRYATASVTFRGEVSSREAQQLCRSTIDKNSSYFYEWIPQNIHCSLCSISSPGKPLSALLIGNNTAIQQVFKRESQKFTALFRRKAFLHWYTAEGMDQMEFTEAESNTNDLISEYQDWSCGCDCGEEQHEEQEYG